MGRLHLIELEDQPWCPAPIRDGATDYLQLTQQVADLFGPAASLLAAALRRTGATRILDLCAGGAGPWHRLLPALEVQGLEPDVLLTDLHPNADAFSRAKKDSRGRLEGLPAPVDARHVPEELTGFRTIFNALHHFRPDDARAILRNAVERREGIAVFEAVERTAPSIVGILPSPIAVLLLTPLMRPFRWSRLLFTYLLPVIPLLVLFDGVVSCLRVYSPEELRALVGGLGETGYDWEIGRLPGKGPAKITYLIGVPRTPPQLPASGNA